MTTIQDRNKSQTEGKKRKIWQCNNCAELFKTKQALVEHLIDEFDMATEEADRCECQLEELNVKNY